MRTSGPPRLIIVSLHLIPLIPLPARSDRTTVLDRLRVVAIAWIKRGFEECLSALSREPN